MTAHPVTGAGSQNEGGGGPPRGRERFVELARKEHTRTLALTTVVLAAGLALLWLTKTVVGIESDAVYMALVLVPAIVLLAMTNRLAQFNFLGTSAVFRDVQTQVENLDKSITDVGQREPERASYLGKLKQVIDKDGREFALIYADVDGLRQVMRKLYDDARKSGTHRRDQEIRDEIIERLEIALTDAFYEVTERHERAKSDVFRLVEPDIAMIVRSVTSHDAAKIADRATELFPGKEGWTTTMAVHAATRHVDAVTPEALDEAAAAELVAKKKGRASAS